jgi:hypothetical protein
MVTLAVFVLAIDWRVTLAERSLLLIWRLPAAAGQGRAMRFASQGSGRKSPPTKVGSAGTSSLVGPIMHSTSADLSPYLVDKIT